MDFLETIESIRQSDASVNRIFSGEGRSISGLRRTDPHYRSQYTEALRLVEGVIKGKRPSHHLVEAMSTSDFPLLFADILDRSVLASYREAPYSWNQIVRERTVNDFRTIKLFTMDGAESPLDDVPELTEYKAAALTEAKYELAIKKYGRRLAFSFEARLNDDLDQLISIPERFGRAARRTEERLVTDLFVDANGPDATFFSVGNGNRITGNPALSITGLQTGLTQLAAQTDVDGDPITLDMATLWVPPALEIPAQNILNAVQLEIGDSGSATVPRMITANWMRNRMTLAVGTYIPNIASSANGSTSWFLFAKPSEGRPAGIAAKLRGHEDPEVWIKSANAQRAGGGVVDALEGDFDSDGIQYRVRACFGVALVDPKSAVASNGSGS